MRVRFAIAAFVLVAVLVSCRASEGRDQHLAALRTGRFELTIVAHDPTGPVTLRATGAFDDDRGVFLLRTEASTLLPGFDGSLAVIATPEAMYVDCPYLTRMLEVPTRWLVVRGSASEPMRSVIDGLVHTSPMRFADGSEEGSALVSLKYFDVGAPVVIDPPAMDQVTDETEEFNRLFGGTTGG